MPRLFLLALVIGLVAHGVGPAADPPAAASLAFRQAENTGLADILRARRELLEKRLGKTPTGHQWWLWGLAGFDYDRDGDLDLVVSVHGAKNGVIIKNLLKETGALKFQDATIELGADGQVPAADNQPLIWDIDGDGYLDVAGLFNDSPTTCLFNRGGKRFEKADFSLHPLNYPSPPQDHDGDGYLDIEQVVRGQRVRMLYRPEQKRFEKIVSDYQPPVALPAAVTAELAEIAGKKENRFIKVHYITDRDLDNDGKADVVVSGFASYNGDCLGRYLLTGADGALADQTAELGLPKAGTPCFLADLDGDGDVDLLIAASPQGGLYLNDGKGKFVHRPGPLTDFIKNRLPYLQRVLRADLDNDGDSDLVISSRRHGQQRVFENRGQGQFIEALAAKGWDADPLVIDDIDQDGRLDVIIGGAGDKENIGVFLNATKSAGTFCQIRLEMNGPNRHAAGARVEVFTAGTLGNPAARPWWQDTAATDARPIHVGLAAAKTFDLRVTFPGGKQVTASKQTGQRLLVTPEGVKNLAP